MAFRMLALEVTPRNSISVISPSIVTKGPKKRWSTPFIMILMTVMGWSSSGFFVLDDVVVRDGKGVLEVFKGHLQGFNLVIAGQALA
jgi:hypothetical protein